MKTRNLCLALALTAIAPVAFFACSSDDSSQQDGGPHNGQDATTDTGNPETSTTSDASTPDAPNACATGLVFDNTLVPGWPNNIPQP